MTKQQIIDKLNKIGKKPLTTMNKALKKSLEEKLEQIEGKTVNK